MSHVINQSGIQSPLKWVGGKRKLVPKILGLIPEKPNCYFEPFLGGGSVLFALPKTWTKFGSDLNSELINFYVTCRDQPEALIEKLESFENSKEFFMTVRAIDRDHLTFSRLDKVTRAARFFYLNKTAYNGMYRVNAKGEFNVPFGKYPGDVHKKSAILESFSAYLNVKNSEGIAVTRFEEFSYEKTMEIAQEGDLVYLDPPYDAISSTSSFVSYQKEGFTRDAQILLAERVNELHRRGVKFILSNAATPLILELYAGYKNVENPVMVQRNVSAQASSRIQVPEILVTNYGMT